MLINFLLVQIDHLTNELTLHKYSSAFLLKSVCKDILSSQMFKVFRVFLKTKRIVSNSSVLVLNRQTVQEKKPMVPCYDALTAATQLYNT